MRERKRIIQTPTIIYETRGRKRLADFQEQQSKKRRKTRNNFKNFNHNSLIQFKSPDNYGLFYAIFLTYTYMQQNRSNPSACTTEYKRLNRIKKNIEKGNGITYILQTLTDCNIALDQPVYEPEIYLPLIQNWLNYTFPNLAYKLYVFKSSWSLCKNYRPFWVGEVELGIALPIFWDDIKNTTCYAGIRNMNSLFPRGSLYCFSCRQTYSNVHTHQCAMKCYSCVKMGTRFGCSLVKDETVSCLLCKRCFQSQECFDRHLLLKQVTTMKKDPKTMLTVYTREMLSTCSLWKMCELCGVEYKRSQTHPCGEY